MPDRPVYMIANLTIEDPAAYRVYEKGFFPLLKKHGGTFIAYDDATHTLEGAAPLTGRVVLLRFPSESAARAWFDDPDYQAIAASRREGSRLNFLTIVHGQEQRD